MLLGQLELEVQLLLQFSEISVQFLAPVGVGVGERRGVGVLVALIALIGVAVAEGREVTTRVGVLVGLCRPQS